MKRFLEHLPLYHVFMLLSAASPWLSLTIGLLRQKAIFVLFDFVSDHP